MTPQLELAAITDEFSPALETALEAMSAIGMTGVELRVVWGNNILRPLGRRGRARHGPRPFTRDARPLDCVAVAQVRVARRRRRGYAFPAGQLQLRPHLGRPAAAGGGGAPAVRASPGPESCASSPTGRTVEPARLHATICQALSELARQAAPQGVIIGLENEHACNIARRLKPSRF